MTSAKIQPFSRNYNINIGCLDGTRINSRDFTGRNLALKIHNYHFCLIWKTNDNAFNQALKKLKLKFKVFDKVISDNHVKVLPIMNTNLKMFNLH